MLLTHQVALSLYLKQRLAWRFPQAHEKLHQTSGLTLQEKFAYRWQQLQFPFDSAKDLLNTKIKTRKKGNWR
jgi:hypothetical protein